MYAVLVHSSGFEIRDTNFKSSFILHSGFRDAQAVRFSDPSVQVGKKAFEERHLARLIEVMHGVKRKEISGLRTQRFELGGSKSGRSVEVETRRQFLERISKTHAVESQLVPEDSFADLIEVDFAPEILVVPE